MNDFLPVEDKTDMRALANIESAVKLGLAPKGRATMTRKLALRPAINTTELPKKKGVQRCWPQIVCRHRGVIFERFEDNTVVYLTHVHPVINGCPVAYHPYDQNALGQIAEQEARGFCALVKNAAGELVRQGPGDPVPGHLVSRTAYQHKGFEREDPRRYLDAKNVPYVSVPVELMLAYKEHWGCILGSAVVLRDRTRGNYAFTAVVGDVDTTGVGGVSQCIWEQLNIGCAGAASPLFEFRIYAGKAHDGYELQNWQP